MPIFELIAIASGVALVWFWIDSVGARETALREAAIACQVDGLQLLDDTVAVRSLRISRSESGRLRWRREYAFEFSDTGDNRRSGSLILVGDQIEMLQLQPNVYLLPPSH